MIAYFLDGLSARFPPVMGGADIRIAVPFR